MWCIFLTGCTDSNGREVAPATVCVRNLERVGRAVAHYCADKKMLPATTVSVGGELLSWRVLVAPYLMEEPFRSRFDYHTNEPWDSPWNRTLCAGWAVMLYTCPLEAENVDYPFVSYQLLVRSPSGNDGVKDRIVLPQDAIIIVESTGCGVEFGEPKDIGFESLFQGDSPFGVGKLNSLHPHSVRALRVDGKVVEIPKTISSQALRKLLNGSSRNPN